VNLDAVGKTLKRQRATIDLDNVRAYALRIRKQLRDGDHILDIGCGVGVVDVAIAEVVRARFTLIDRTGMDKSRPSWSANGYPANDLAITRQVVADNGIDAEVVDIAAYDWRGPVDVVISTLSWGWHYPVGLYRERVLRLGPRVIILDCRDLKATFDGYERVDKFTMNRKERTLVFRR
jgi:SAM-dependent methyltransferase